MISPLDRIQFDRQFDPIIGMLWDIKFASVFIINYVCIKNCIKYQNMGHLAQCTMHTWRIAGIYFQAISFSIASWILNSQRMQYHTSCHNVKP